MNYNILNKKLLSIMTQLNLVSDDEEFNNLIKNGYNIILDPIFQNDLNESKGLLKNNFLLCIDDIAAIETKIPTMEKKEFVRKIIQENTLSVGNKIYKLSPIQMEIFNKMHGKNHIFSFPTSSGKSLLIRIFAEKRDMENLRTIIISPTIALINEYYKTFSDNGITTSTNPFSNSNILILTQERALNLKLKESDAIIIDEAYVMFEKNSRTDKLFHLLYRALEIKNKIHLFIPNINNAYDGFENKIFLNKFKLFQSFKSITTRTTNPPKIKPRKDAFNNIKNRKEKIMIFDYKRYTHWWMQYFDSLDEIKEFTKKEKILFNFLEYEFGRKFSLLKSLKRGLVIINGNSPKLFRFVSELLYKESTSIRFVLGNSALSRGVNFKPDKIIIFSKNFIDQSVKIFDNFELRNAIGRSGRYDIDDLKKRVGNVEICATSGNIEEFKDNFNKFTNDKLEAKTYIKNDDRTSESYNFDFYQQENIEWQKSSFGISRSNIKDMVENHKKEFEEYLKYKYVLKKKDFSKDKFDNIWEIFISNEKLKLKLLKETYRIIIGNKFVQKNELIDFTDSEIKRILETLKYQGFHETLIIERTYYQSAISEFNKICKKNINNKEKLFFDNSNFGNITYNTNKILIEKDMNFKSNVINFLIFRKDKISSTFIENILIPLDFEIANILNIDISEYDEIDIFMEKHSIPQTLHSTIARLHFKDKNKILLDICKENDLISLFLNEK